MQMQQQVSNSSPVNVHMIVHRIEMDKQIMTTTINIPNTCNSNDCLPYLFGNREDYLNLVVPLYEASNTSDWKTAKLIFDKRPDLVRFGLCKNLGTALHVAATAQQYQLTSDNLNFVKNLVNMMTPDELELKNEHSNTAFWLAAAFGNILVARIMMEKNHNLLNIRGSDGLLPLTASAASGRSSTTSYLYDCSQKMSGDHWTDSDRDLTLFHCVERKMVGIALQILEDRPELARNVSLLEVLARTPYASYRVHTRVRTMLAIKILNIIWGHATRTMNIDEIEHLLRGPPTYLANGTIQYSSRILFVAAERGHTEFIIELLRTYPDLMLDINEDGLSIFHIAVMHRHRHIYNLLSKVGGSFRKDILLLKDKSDNNMLHLVGMTSKKMATKNYRASLLMQRELLWFQDVYWTIPSYLREVKNKDGKKPYEIFSEENEDQVSKGLKWMKDCMVVATLIVTVAFAVAFTVPGGYNQEDGLPIFIHHPTLLTFVIADAISLFSSSTSLLVFLSILTSRHQQEDFLESLPKKLMFGLLALFVSVAAMMVTFSASFFLLYHNKLKWVPNLIAISASLPVVVFARLQFPLVVDMFRSMYDRNYLFSPKKPIYVLQTKT